MVVDRTYHYFPPFSLLKNLPSFFSLICQCAQGPLLPSPFLSAPLPSSALPLMTVTGIQYSCPYLTSPVLAKALRLLICLFNSFMRHFHFEYSTGFSNTIIPLTLTPLYLLMKDGLVVIQTGALEINPDFLLSLNPTSIWSQCHLDSTWYILVIPITSFLCFKKTVNINTGDKI